MSATATRTVNLASVDVRIDDPGWNETVPNLETLCARALDAVLAACSRPAAQAGFLFADDAALRRLNAAYRGKDAPTNVLSFPADPSALPPEVRDYLGDIAIARETVLAEAAAQNKSASDHTAHMIVHGTLHLLGYDHEAAGDADEMETLERGILAGLGVADPYAVRAEAS